jgi:hypothetical protein
MQNISYPPSRPLAVGEILDLTFRIYRASLLGCMLFAALGVVTNWLPRLYSLGTGASVAQSLLRPQLNATFTLLTLVGAVLTITFSAAVVLRQYAIASGRPVGGEFTAAARRIPGIALLIILWFLVILVCAFAIAPAFLLPTITTKVLAGVILCIPMLYAAVAYSCAYPAMLVTPMGAAAAFGRSWRLTRGSFWRLSLIYGVGIIILFVLYSLTWGVAGVLISIFGRGDVAVLTATLAVVAVAVGALATPFYTALSLAILGDLSARKDGTDLAQRIAAT